MDEKPVTVVVKIRAKPDRSAEVRRELNNLVAPTRKEEGCINYDLHQAADDPSLFLFHENWTSEAALKRHFQTPHIRHWLERSKDLLAETMDLTLWHKYE